jgi:uncharacterized protein
VTVSHTPTARSEQLGKLLRETLVHDLRMGTARSGLGRELYMGTDTLRGIVDALRYEAGDAWRLLLHSCGRAWGRRVVRTSETRLQQAVNARTGQLSVEEFDQWWEDWFAAQGWGRLRLDLQHADAGIVVATLENSLWVEVLPDFDEPVDHLIAGVLAAVFTDVAGRELDALEVACVRAGSPRCVFAITTGQRLDAVRDRVERRESADAVLAALRTVEG